MTTPPTLTFYRIVENTPPTPWDFTSNEAKGLSLRRPTPETTRWWAGISVHETETGARNLALQRPGLGRFIAEIRIPDDRSVLYERTGSRPGHYTVWGDPAALLAGVVSVVAI